MAVGNIKDAPLQMNALAITDMRLTSADLQTRIMHHYRQEVLRQLYRILGSADFIGNPVGLFTNVSSGVADIFYEPFNGAVMHGNHDLGIGIAKVRLLQKPTLYFTRHALSGSCKLRQKDCLRSF
jgi:vacuolar protein sorting-associated protein 13A/C